MKKTTNSLLIVRVAYILLLGLALSTQLHANGPYYMNLFDPSIVDARGEALGHSSLLTSEGANNTFNNPAKLALVKHLSFYIDSRGTFGKNESSNSMDGSTDKAHIHFVPTINGCVIAMPLPVDLLMDAKVGFGFGYQKYYDWSLSYTDDEELASDYKVDSNGGFGVITFAMGMQKNKLAVGIGFNMSTASRLRIVEQYNNEEETSTSYKYTGHFVTLSTSYQFSQQMQAAFRIRTPFNLERTNKSLIEYSAKYSDITKYDIPTELVVGLAYQPTDKVNVIGEVATRNVGSYQMDGNENEDIDPGYGVHVGVEYGKVNVWRAGAFMQSSSYPDKTSDANGNLFDKNYANPEKGLTIGYGYRGSASYTFDISYGYSFMEYQRTQVDKWKAERSKFCCSVGLNFK